MLHWMVAGWLQTADWCMVSKTVQEPSQTADKLYPVTVSSNILTLRLTFRDTLAKAVKCYQKSSGGKVAVDQSDSFALGDGWDLINVVFKTNTTCQQYRIGIHSKYLKLLQFNCFDNIGVQLICDLVTEENSR